jgi:DNA mismatch repair protein MutS
MNCCKWYKIAVGLRKGAIKKEVPVEELPPIEQLDIF